MQEISPEPNEEQMKQGEYKEAFPSHHTEQSRSHESLWGALIFACMLIFVLASVASIGWGVYSQWKHDRSEKSEPSIAVLSQQPSEQAEATGSEAKDSEGDAAKKSEEKSATVDLTVVKKMLISVLNGGSAKGSAGVASTFFNGEGFINVTPGNTLSDYSGVVVYYAAGLEKEADMIKTVVMKKYPQAKILPADVKNKETSVSQITVILGK